MTNPLEIWDELKERRFFPILAAYFGGGWVFLEFFGFVVDTLHLAPSLKLTALTLLAAFVPTAGVIAYFHGRPGKDPITKTEKIFIPLNVLAVFLVLTFMPPGSVSSTPTTTDASVMRVKYEDDSGSITERTLVRPQFQTPLMLYLFQNNTGDSANDWLEFWFIDGLLEDLNQNNYLTFSNQYINQGAISRLEMERPSTVPLSIQLKWAQDAGSKYLINGDFRKEGELWQVRARVYDVKQGKILLDQNIVDTSVIEIIDLLSVPIKRAINLSEKQINAFQDLPVRELTSYNVEAIESYSEYWCSVTWKDDAEQALVDIKAAVTADPTFALAQFLAWQHCFKLNRPDWVDHLEAAMRFKDRLSDNNRQLLEYYYFLVLGNDEAADHALSRWIALAPNNPQPYLFRAQQFNRDGKRQEALANLIRVNQMNPENEEALDALSRISLELGRTDDALGYANQFINDHPGRDLGYLLKGNALRATGDYAGALHAYEQAYGNDPRQIANWIAVAREKARQGNIQAVVKQTETMLDQRSAVRDQVQLYRLLYDLEKDQGHFIDAVKVYREMMALGRNTMMPINYFVTWIPLIQDLARMNFDNEANFIVNTMEKNLKILGNEITVLAKFAFYLQKDEPDSLERYWTTWTGIPGYKNVVIQYTVDFDLYAQARICYLRKDYSSAKVYLDRLRQISTTNFLVEEAEMRIKMGEHEQGQNLLETHLVLNPQDMQAYYTLAESYIARGETEQAKQVVAVLNQLMKSADDILPVVTATRELQTHLGSPQSS